MSGAGRRKVSAEQLAATPTRFVYLARGSRATVALLRRLVPTTRPTIVWSLWRGYLDRGGPIPDFCAAHGMEPLLIHTSGHAHPEDLASLADRLRPQGVVPVHTEAADRFSEFMPNVRLVNDGEAVAVESLMGEPKAC